MAFVRVLIPVACIFGGIILILGLACGAVAVGFSNPVMGWSLGGLDVVVAILLVTTFFWSATRPQKN